MNDERLMAELVALRASLRRTKADPAAIELVSRMIAGRRGVVPVPGRQNPHFEVNGRQFQVQHRGTFSLGR